MATTTGGETNRVSALLPERAPAVSSAGEARAAASAEWTHVAATWDGGDACGEAVVYIDGQAAADACLGDAWTGTAVNSLRLGYLAGGGRSRRPRAWLDDVAVWRQALTPAQVAGLHALGGRSGYDAARVNTLFDALRDNTVTVGPGRI